MSSIQTSLILNDRLTPVLRKVNAAMSGVLDSFSAVSRACGTGFDSSAIAAARIQIDAAGAAVDDMAKYYENCNNEQNKLKRGAGGLHDTLSGISAVVFTVGTVQKIVQLSDTVMQTTARLNQMNDGLQSTEQLTNMIYTAAQNSRGSYSDMADIVAKLGNNAGDAFGSTAEIVKFAETVQKQFTNAGTGTTEASAAMLQLTQALGSGVLRGDELNSIFEQAPTLIQSIASYMDVPIGQIRGLASEGKLSADIVKNAILSSADETNAVFNQMPYTWGQVWSSMKNQAIFALQPVLTQVSNLANNQGIQNSLSVLMGKFAGLMRILGGIISTVFAIVGCIGNNWSIIEPMITVITIAMTAYMTATKGVAAAHIIATATGKAFKAVQTFLSIGFGVLTHSTNAAKRATELYNTALLACPITWIILAIAAVIAVIYAVVAAINRVTGATVSATGIIFGAVCTVAATVWNVCIGVVNAIIMALWYVFVSPFIGIIEFVLNAANGGFTSFGGAVLNLIGNLISNFMSLGKVVTNVIDAIFGTEWSEKLTDLQNTVQSWGKSDTAITLSKEAPTLQTLTGGTIDRWAYADAWNAGYSAGESVDSAVSGFFGFGTVGVDDYFTGVTDGISDISYDTDSISKNTEDLSYLRDIAERDAINRFTTAEIKVDMSGMSNRIDSNMDLDGVIAYLTDGVEEALVTAGEGVY